MPEDRCFLAHELMEKDRIPAHEAGGGRFGTPALNGWFKLGKRASPVGEKG